MAEEATTSSHNNASANKPTHNDGMNGDPMNVDNGLAEEDQRTRTIDSKPGWGLYVDVEEANEWFVLTSGLGVLKAPRELERADLVGKAFNSLHDAEIFYMIYSRAMGFGIRKSQKRTTPDGVVKNRTWLCSKEGHREQKYLNMENRKREPKAITREGCNVKFRVNFCKDTNKWKVKEFVTCHSHQLAIPSHIQFMSSNRVPSGGAIKTAKAMKHVGVKTCHIMSYFAESVGGYDNVRFTIKDLYNRLSRQPSCNLLDSDAAQAIGYLQHKCDQDIGLFGKYTFDEHNRLENLIWADGKCRSDYSHFGEVLSFDTTYKTNAYGKPLLVFVGINNHFRTIIYGFALLKNETVETYRWALRAFLECMHEKLPRTVITDGDLAIKAAINEVMPGTVHRLCSWHIEHNAVTNIHKPGFTAALKGLMFRYYTPEKFDEAWNNMVDEFGLQENAWVQWLYDGRHAWADTFLRGNFFGGMSSTQRCEKMHHVLKLKIDGNFKLWDVVRSMEMSVMWLRHKESQDEFISSFTQPVLNATNMPSVEEEAAKVYTRQIFFLVRAELKKEGRYIANALTAHEYNITCRLLKYGNVKNYRDVVVSNNGSEFHCPCELLSTKGIPCRHIFACMKAMHVTTLPKSLILRRWTKDAKNDDKHAVGRSAPWMNCIKDEKWRFGHMTSKCSEIAFIASQSDELFAKALEEIEKVSTTLKAQFDPVNLEGIQPTPQKVEIQQNIQNPENSRTKGGWSGSKKDGWGKKHCTLCHAAGHNKATCTLNKGKGKRLSQSEDEGSVFEAPANEATCGTTEEREGADYVRIDTRTMHDEFSEDAWLGQPY